MSDDNEGMFEILVMEGQEPTSQRMIVVKQLGNGDMHAEDNDGQMIIIRTDGTVKSFLLGDENWVTGRVSNPGMAWEVIGFHLGLTDGHSMERTRNERTS